IDRSVFSRRRVSGRIYVHSDLLPSASSPVHVEVLQGCVEMHQGRILRSCYDAPCQSVVQSRYNVNTDIIRNLKTEPVLVHAY
uniref:Uncharacterized protein n=1 Tax=Sus scrofa TaxID=9823 RepID=A0A4X1VJ55_PIG